MAIRWGFSFIGMLICIQLQAQSFQKSTISLIDGESFQLSSRSIGFFTGDHSIVLEIDLPANTVEWHYRFYSFQNEQQAQKHTTKLKLLQELDRSLIETGNLKTQVGEYPADVMKGQVSTYLLKDSSQVEVFNARFPFGLLQYHHTSSIIAPAAWVRVSEPAFIRGKQYLAISNSQSLQESIVFLEAVAIIQIPKPVLNGWSAPELESWYAEVIDISARLSGESLHPSQYAAVATCFQSTLENQLSAEKYNSISEVEKQQWKSWIFARCLEIGRQQAIQPYKHADAYLLAGQWKTEKGEALDISFNGTMSLQKNNGKYLTGTWHLSENSLTLHFSGYKKQTYRSVVVSRNFVAFENNLTGNFLRMNRVIPSP
jgi:hypothetical protein